MIKIYKLIHDGQIVYVGQTKQKYLSSRKKLGYGDTIPFFKECKIELIEETDDITRERYWIDRLKNEGHPLLNMNRGRGFNKKEYQKKYQNFITQTGASKEYQKEWREKNREKKREYDRKYYHDKIKKIK